MSLIKRCFARWRLLLAVLLFLLAGFAYYFSRPTPAPPTLILPLSANVPKNNLPLSDRFDLWIPHSWSWYWRMKPHIFGSRQDVHIQATIFEVSDSPSLPNLLKGGIELTNMSGIRALSFSPNELKNLRDRLAKPSLAEQPHLDIFRGARIQTADAIEASVGMSVGTNQPVRNIEIGTFPRVYQDAIDLTTSILLTELVSETNSPYTHTKTNLALWTRSRIPDASGLLLLDFRPSSASNTKHTAILLSANLTSPAKPGAKSVQPQTKP